MLTSKDGKAAMKLLGRGNQLNASSCEHERCEQAESNDSRGTQASRWYQESLLISGCAGEKMGSIRDESHSRLSTLMRSSPIA